MRYLLFVVLQISSGVGISVASAQQLAYSTFAVTECVTETDSPSDHDAIRPTGPIVNIAPMAKNEHSAPITLSYSMPHCASGDCPGCTILSSFTTAYPAFQTAGAVGMKRQNYVITETYVGLSSLPTFAKPTQLPYGFVTGVETCNSGVCGPEAITATVTYPAGNAPFAGATAHAHGSGCGPGGGAECPSLPTHTGSLDIAAVPFMAPAQPAAVVAAVVAGGNVLQGPYGLAIAFIMLIAVL